jgi:hypothetical protein
MIFVLCLFACKESKSKMAAEEAKKIGNYHGIVEGASWTYRDDGEDFDTGIAPPDEDSLVLAQNMGNGSIEFRRGTRWADATQYGTIQFRATDTELVLLDWSLAQNSGSGSYPIADELPEDGEVISSGDWSCTTTRPEFLWTYYGYFDDVLTFECRGAGLEGNYSFAKETGLVLFEGMDGYRLDLVAPW